MKWLGDLTENQTVDFKFSTHQADGTPITLAGTPVVKIYKANATDSEVATGVTLTVDFDTVTGLHHVRIDTSDAFYAVANDYSVVITTGTVDGVSVVGTVLATFSIENRYGSSSRYFQNVAREAHGVAGTEWHFASAAVGGNDANDGLSWKTPKADPTLVAPTAGDEIRLGACEFDLGVTYIQQVEGVNIRGSGMGSTRVVTANDSRAGIEIASYAEVTDLTVISSVYAAIGTSDVTATDAVLRRVRAYGLTDGMIVAGPYANCTVRVCDSILESTYDGLATQSGDHEVYLYDTVVRSVGPCASGPTNGVVVYQGGFVAMVGGSIEARNGTGFTKGVRLPGGGFGTGSFIGLGVDIYTSTSTDADKSVSNEGPGKATLIGGDYDRAKFSNTGAGSIVEIAADVTAQGVRDAMKLAPTSGDPAAGSVDKHLDDIPTTAAPTTAQIKTAVEAAGGHLALILEDTGTTLPGTLTTIAGYVDCLPATWVTVPTAAQIKIAVEAEGSSLAAIKAKTDLIVAGGVTIASPILSDGSLEIIRGDAYDAADGRAITLTDTGSTWPDLTEATVTLSIRLKKTDALEATIVGTVADPGTATQSVTFEPTAEDTAALTPAYEAEETHWYDVQAAWTVGGPVTLAGPAGCTVRQDVTR